MDNEQEVSPSGLPDSVDPINSATDRLILTKPDGKLYRVAPSLLPSGMAMPSTPGTGGGDNTGAPLTYSSVARVDVDHTALGVDLKTSPNTPYQAVANASQHTITADGTNYLRADGTHTTPRIKYHQISGEGKVATLDAGRNISVPSGFTPGSTNDWGVAINGNRVAVGYATSNSAVKIQFGTLTPGSSASISWSSTSISVATAGYTSATSTAFDLALNSSTLVIYRKGGSTAKLFFSTLSGSDKDTTITSTSSGSNITSNTRGIDLENNRFVYAIGGSNRRIGVANMSGTGSSASVGTAILTAIGDRNIAITGTPTINYEVANFQGVAITSSTFLMELEYTLKAGQSGSDAKRRYTWVGFVAGGADVAVGQITQSTRFTTYSGPNGFYNVVIVSGVSNQTYSGTTAAEISIDGAPNYLPDTIRFGTLDLSGSSPVIDWGNYITPSSRRGYFQSGELAINSQYLLTTRNFIKLNGTGKTTTLGGVITLTGASMNLSSVYKFYLNDDNIVTTFTIGSSGVAGRLKVYELVISGATANVVEIEDISVPVQGATWPSDMYIYQGSIYYIYSDNSIRVSSYSYNLFTTELVPSPPSGYSIDGSVLIAPNLISGSIVRGYRIRSYQEQVGSDLLLGTTYIQAGVRGNEGTQQLADQSYYIDNYQIPTTTGVIARFVYGLRIDAANHALALRSYIGRILGDVYFTIDAITGTGQLPGSDEVISADFGDADLTATLENTDRMLLWRPSNSEYLAFTIATLRGLLTTLSGGLTASSVAPIITAAINRVLEPFAKIGDATAIPADKLVNAPGIVHLATGYTSSVGKNSDKFYGNGGTTNLEVAYYKHYDAQKAQLRVDNLDDDYTGFSTNGGAIRPVVPAGLMEFKTKGTTATMLVATNTSNLISSTPASYRIRYRTGGGSWVSLTLAKRNPVGQNTPYDVATGATELQAGEIYELQIGTANAQGAVSYINLHTGSYMAPLIDVDSIQKWLATIKTEAINSVPEETGEDIKNKLEHLLPDNYLSTLFLQGNPYLEELKTLPDPENRRNGELVVRKKGSDNYNLTYLADDVSIATPERNKLTITLSQQRIFWYGAGGTGVSVRDYNGFLGRYEVGIYSSTRFVRLFLREDMLDAVGISRTNTQSTCFQAAITTTGGTKNYLTFIRTASQSTINGQRYLEYQSSQGNATGRPNAQGGTYDIFFRNADNTADINILPATTIGRGWVSTLPDGDYIVRALEARTGDDRLDIQSTKNNPVVTEYTTLPAVAGHKEGEIITATIGGVTRMYQLGSQTTTITNRQQIQVATGSQVATGLDAQGNTTYKIAYDADLPDESEGGRAVRNYQHFVGYLQRQQISATPDVYNMIIYLRQDMLSGLGIPEGVSSSVVAFKAAFTTASEAKTYLRFNRTPQTDYILGHQYLAYTSASSTPPSTTGYPEQASTTYTISFQQATTTANLNVWPQTMTTPDTWVAMAGNAAAFATTGNTDRVPLAKTRNVVLTQAAYNTLSSSRNLEADVFYFIY